MKSFNERRALRLAKSVGASKVTHVLDAFGGEVYEAIYNTLTIEYSGLPTYILATSKDAIILDKEHTYEVLKNIEE